MRRLLILFFISLASASFAFQSEVLEQLWDIPSTEAKARTVRAYNHGNLRVEEIFYLSRPFRREPVKIFGYFSYPRKRSGKLPAILLSHGGGGRASLKRAASWAKRGYAVLAIDLPGKGEKRAGSRSSGPDMDVANLLRTQPDPTCNYLVHAVAAARNGITFLAGRKEVDPNRIGMVGLSWGGVITLLTNGQDDRLKAAVNIFGAGYIPEGCTWVDWFTSMPAVDKETWNNLLDPKNFLAAQHAPILFITGTNDHCYYLPTFQKSYQEVRAEKNYWLIPNLSHRFLESAELPALAWLDQKLKRKSGFPSITQLPAYAKDARIILPVKVKASGLVKSVRLYYNVGGPQLWTKKEWKELRPRPDRGVYYFSVPSNLIKPEILYYMSARDNRGGASSTLVRSLFAVKLKDGKRTFAVSSPLIKQYRHQAPATLLGGAEGKNLGFIFSKSDAAYRTYELP